MLFMKSVGIKVLKNKLSAYVRLAAAGEIILITDRDTVVAELRPPSESRSPILADAMLAGAVRSGWLRPPALPSDHEVPEGKPVMSLEQILAGLASDRENR